MIRHVRGINMKKSEKAIGFGIIVILLGVSVFLVLNPAKNSVKMPPPRETIVLDRQETVDYHKRRELWIEEMHAASPEINWRLMDQETRNAKAARKALGGDSSSGAIIRGSSRCGM